MADLVYSRTMSIRLSIMIDKRDQEAILTFSDGETGMEITIDGDELTWAISIPYTVSFPREMYDTLKRMLVHQKCIMALDGHDILKLEISTEEKISSRMCEKIRVCFALHLCV
jgi:hypothetical protein